MFGVKFGVGYKVSRAECRPDEKSCTWREFSNKHFFHLKVNIETI